MLQTTKEEYFVTKKYTIRVSIWIAKDLKHHIFHKMDTKFKTLGSIWEKGKGTTRPSLKEHLNINYYLNKD